ncbi:ISAs1 family transposase, partial [Sansalvadorimonas sp. 2012CJ34-2]
MNAFTLIEHFSKLPDYRQPWKVEHKLTDILLLVTCAMISGARGWKEIEDFGKYREEWLKKLGDFAGGIPSHDTIERVVSLVNPQQFHQYFSAWMQDCHEATAGVVVAIDGKTVRGSGDRKNQLDPIHMV